MNLGDTDQQFCEQQSFVIHCWSPQPPIVILCTRMFEGTSLFHGVTSGKGFTQVVIFRCYFAKDHLNNSDSLIMNRESCCRVFLLMLFSRGSIKALEILFLGIRYYEGDLELHYYENCHSVLF